MKKRYKEFSDIPLLDIPDEADSDDRPPVGFVIADDADEPAVEVAPPRAPSGEKFVVLRESGVTGPSRQGPEIREKPSANAVVAERFIDLVRNGTVREEAALQAVGLPYAIFKGRRDVVECVQALMDTFHLEPDVRAKSRAGFLNKLMLEGAVSDDPMTKKLGLEASKQIAADGGVSDTNINVNLGDLKKFLE